MTGAGGQPRAVAWTMLKRVSYAFCQLLRHCTFVEQIALQAMSSLLSFFPHLESSQGATLSLSIVTSWLRSHFQVNCELLLIL